MRFLFVPMDAFSHISACLGLALSFKESGHQCIFAVPCQWRKMIESSGLLVEPIIDSESNIDEDPQDKHAKIASQITGLLRLPVYQQMQYCEPYAKKSWLDYAMRIDDQIATIINKLTPDATLVDLYVTLPSLVNSGKPWFLLYSANPLFAYCYGRSDRPPYYSGYSVNDNPDLFTKFMEDRLKANETFKKSSDDWLISKGIEPHSTEMILLSPYLNIYCYPDELDYSLDYGSLSDKWFRVDHMVRVASDSPLGFDEKFFDTLKPDNKLIYFSLGSIGSGDLELMKRLIGFLSKVKHKIIVSKGINHEKFKLPFNMIGGKFVNQMKILPKVDLVITHGGNNTFIETLYFGKPMVILPMFSDQHDNGRRLEDKQLGRSLSLYTCTEQELIDAINYTLNNSEIIQRVSKIGEQLRKSQSIKQLINKMESIVQSSVNKAS